MGEDTSRGIFQRRPDRDLPGGNRLCRRDRHEPCDQAQVLAEVGRVRGRIAKDGQTTCDQWVIDDMNMGNRHRGRHKAESTLESL